MSTVEYKYELLNTKMSTAEHKCESLNVKTSIVKHKRESLNIKMSTVEHKCNSLSIKISTVGYKCESRIALYCCWILNRLFLKVFKPMCWTHESQSLNFATNKQS